MVGDAAGPGEGQQDDAMGGTGWEGVPAGTSGSAAPGTEGAGQGETGGAPEGERPTRRGHEDVGDASGELGVVGKGLQTTSESADAEGEVPRDAGAAGDAASQDAPADAGLGVNARGRRQGESSGVGPQATTGPGRAAGEGASAGASGVGDQSEHGGSDGDRDG